MPTSTLTTRGQTTIPKPIREALGLQPGDRVEFSLHGDRALLRRAGADLSALDGMLDRSGREPISVEEMKDAIGDTTREDTGAVDAGSEADEGWSWGGLTQKTSLSDTSDHPEQYRAAKRHLESTCTRENPGYVNVIVLYEWSSYVSLPGYWPPPITQAGTN